MVFSLFFRFLGVTLENEAYMLGLGGAKSGNVEKALVFKAFLEGQRSHEESRTGCSPASRSGWEGLGGG